MSASAILGRDLLTKPGYTIKFINNKINIIDLNEDENVKVTNDNFNEILCIDYYLDVSARKETAIVNPGFRL